ncbi:hypothetical protein PC116_g24873 [Phytophthora cactorum]|nr:hypothetical protein PC114_g22929 [Phytophthora cactorum]KAG3138162.1 hypothetical protein C6341_g20743 [Phytophthora cactorum]KAG4226724.1 hypothetical protein PC116_g24873 [Phytophthora cactorum]
MRGWAKLSPSEVVGSLFPSCLAFRGDGERKYKHRVSSVTGHTAPCTEEVRASESIQALSERQLTSPWPTGTTDQD